MSGNDVTTQLTTAISWNVAIPTSYIPGLLFSSLLAFLPCSSSDLLPPSPRWQKTIVVSTVFVSVIALMCSCQCHLFNFVQIPCEYMPLFFLHVVSLNFTFPRLAFINLLCGYIIPSEELWIIVHENGVIFRLVPLWHNGLGKQADLKRLPWHLAKLSLSLLTIGNKPFSQI